MRLAPLLALFAIAVVAAAGAAADAAELPLGVVEQGDAQQVVLRFDPSVRLLPGSMVAIYGPGRVEKHPLTKEAIIEARALVAKAQIVGMQDMRLRARVTWSSTPPTAGMDVVPLPNEAAPNAAPSLTGAAVERQEQPPPSTDSRSMAGLPCLAAIIATRAAAEGLRVIVGASIGPM